MVANPSSLTLDDLKAQARGEVEFTLECSGNSAFPFFIGGIGNARWAGARLAPLLASAEPLDQATEVIFWGADSGTVTIRDNPGVTSAGETGTGEADDGGGLDLTITEQFARSMSLDDAMGMDNLLSYEMNGEALPAEHGFPLRLIAPGWYGVANVKWLTRIELVDRRFDGRFMAREYVSVRESVDEAGEARWSFTTVGPARLKSAPAKVTRRDGRYTIIGAAWGAPIATVEVAIDEGPWMPVDVVQTTERIERPFLEPLDVRLGRSRIGCAHHRVTRHRRRRRHPTGIGRSVPRQQEDLLGEQRPDHAPRHDPIAHRVVLTGENQCT